MASGGSWWPSLGWASLPSFDSFTTRHWQRRLLRYLIKRTLAGFLTIPEEDIENSTYLDADLGSGSLRLRDVELNQEAIDEIISKQLADDEGFSPVSIKLLPSHIDSVQVLVGSSDSTAGDRHASEQAYKAVSATERLFNAPIHIIASGIVLDFRIDPNASSLPSGDAAEVKYAKADHEVADLGASILHVAEEYIREDDLEVDEAQITEDEPFGLPGGFDSPSGNRASSGQSALTEQQQIGFIAKVIETLLQRLRISVSDVTINLQFGDNLPLQARLSRMDSKTEVKDQKGNQTQTRTLTIEGLDLYYAIHRLGGPAPSSMFREDSSTTAFTGSSDDLAMSMAIADLRHSDTNVADSGAVSKSVEPRILAHDLEESLYMDAENEDDFGAESIDEEASLGTPQSQKIVSEDSPTEFSQHWRHILGVFDAQSRSNHPATIEARLLTSFAQAPEAASSLVQSERLEITLPTLAATIDLPFIEAVSDFLGQLPTAKTPKPAGAASSKPDSSKLLYTRIQKLLLFVNPQDSPACLADLVRGTTATPEEAIVSLHCFVNTIEGVYRLGGQDGKLAIHDFGLCMKGRQGLRPLILPDPGLIWQYDPEVLRPGDQVSSIGDWSTKQTSDLQEWQAALPEGASSMTASTRLPMLRDALALRLTGTDIKVNMQPVHLWIDVQALDNLMQAITASGFLDKASPVNQDLQQVPPVPSVKPGKQSSTLTVTVPCIRVDIRCPMITSPKEANYSSLRSGIMTIALHDFSCYVRRGRSRDEIAEDMYKSMEVSGSNAFVFMGEPFKQRMEAILWAGALSPSKPLTASLQFVNENNTQIRLHSRVRVRVPSVKGSLSKCHVDALLYLVDDLSRAAGRFSHLLSGPSTSHACGQRTPSKDVKSSEDEPIQCASACNSPSSDRTGISLMEVEIVIDRVQACLNLSGAAGVSQRTFEVDSTSIALNVDLKTQASDQLALKMDVGDLSLIDRGTQTRTLLKQRKPSSKPLLRLYLASTVDSNSSKHSSLTLQLSSPELSVTSDLLLLLEELAQLIRVPPGDFLDVVPAESTQIRIEASQALVKLSPRSLPSSVAIVLDRASFSTRLRQEALVTRCKVKIQSLEGWAADCPQAARSGQHHMKDLGYAQFLDCDGLETLLEARSQPGAENSVAVEIGLEDTRTTMCSDTILCLSDFVSDFVPPSKEVLQTPRRDVSSMSGSVLFANDTLLHRPAKQDTRAAEASPVSQIDGETISIYGRSRLSIDPKWFCKSRLQAEQTVHSRAATFSLKVRPSKVTISFFEGYDYERTRAFVKSAVKATRRKLEKIKQLLAEGQMPEQTIEEAADPLLQSIFLPARPSDGNRTVPIDPSPVPDINDTWKRIVAFDDELDQEEDYDSDSLLMWENLRDRPTMPRRGSSSSMRTSTPRTTRMSRLRRSRASAIDIQLEGLQATMVTFATDNPLASRLVVSIIDLNIVDNLKSSTWHKFLTELKARDGGVTRPTGSPMVRIVLKMLRPAESTEGEEADLSVKVVPLRLHVDQDALDFFKSFFAFRLEPLTVSPASPKFEAAAKLPQTETSGGGFVQRVEIAAIKIKLDYKPKRVDYHALRQGKAIEMMNFFHFEASEMVLRHLVLSGVPNWAKVGDMLQDIWTPDVKANQLADFLSGINPVRTAVNVGHGVADLVLLPVGQYKKDGRLVRGLQRGGTRFAKTTAMEAIKFGARLATGTQVILEHAEHVLGGRLDGASGSPSSGLSASPHSLEPTVRSEWLMTTTEEDEDEDDDRATSDPVSKFSQQPEDVKVGLQTAYKSLSGNVRSAAETILAVPMEVYERSGEGPVRAVVRAVPIAVLRPMIGASEAVSKTLLGLRNTLDPSAKEEIQDKYKRRSNTG